MTNTEIPSDYGPILDSTKAKGDDVCEAAAQAGHQVHLVYGYNSTPDHNNLRCVDFMNGGRSDVQDFVRQYVRDNADRLGVEGYICNGMRCGYPENGTAYHGPSGVESPYSGPNPHTDHVHVEFNAAPIGGPAPAPTPVVETISLSNLLAAAHHDIPMPQNGTALHPVDVNRLQWLLVEAGVLDNNDQSWQRGAYGTGTKDAVQRYQQQEGYTGAAADGYIGTATLHNLCANFGGSTPDDHYVPVR